MEAIVQVSDGGENERATLEASAAEAYLDGRISRRQLSELLGLDYWQTEEFLTARDAKRVYSMADLESDRASLRKVPTP